MARGRSLSRGFARETRGTRTRPFWALGPGGDDIASMDSVVFSSSSQSIMGAGVTPTAQGFTVLRTHGFLELILHSATSLADGF